MAFSLRYDRFVAVANPIALAGVVLAGKVGAAAGRTRPAAAFLAVSTVLALAREADVTARAQRVRARAGSPIEWDVLLREPLFSRGSESCALLAFAAMLGAAASLVGLPGVGAGMSATIGLLGVGILTMVDRWTPRGLMFAADGLHVMVGRGRVVLAWSDIDGAETSGGGDHVELRLLSFQRAAASIVPPSGRAHMRVWYLLHDGSGVTGRLLLPAAIAGVDGGTLARAISDGAARRTAMRPN